MFGLLVCFALIGCESETAEDVANEMEEAVENVQDSMGGMVDEIDGERALEDAAEDVDDGMDDAEVLKEKVEATANRKNKPQKRRSIEVPITETQIDRSTYKSTDPPWLSASSGELSENSPC